MGMSQTSNHLIRENNISWFLSLPVMFFVSFNVMSLFLLSKSVKGDCKKILVFST